MGLIVLRPGAWTTIQDLGRFGYREWGVPAGGACDVESSRLANALADNEPTEAVVEMTMLGGSFEAAAPLALAMAGAAMNARLEPAARPSRALEIPCAFSMRAGDRLHLSAAPQGMRTYLAVHGGWQVPLVLGSRSSETPLKSGDVIPCLEGKAPDRRLKPGWADQAEPLAARVIAGPDAGPCETALQLLIDSTYLVNSQSDRMALRLDGPSLPVAADPERLSTPIAPGAVQVAGGSPMVLLVACGTMGGYPHVAHVLSADLDILAQARPGTAVSFRRIGIEEARAAAADRLRRMDRSSLRIRAAVRDMAS